MTLIVKDGRAIGTLSELWDFIEEKIGESIRLSRSDAGYAIGTQDEETGEWWYGGCDPSNFLNPYLEEDQSYQDWLRDPEAKFVWVFDYPDRNPIQCLSALIDIEGAPMAPN